VVNFPRSPFAPAAALTASLAALYGPSGDGKGTTTNHEWIVSRLKAYLEKMKGGGAPARARILLLLEIVKWSNMGDTEGFERALAAWQEIARITTLAHEKRRALIGAAHAALHIKRPESLEQARALCRQILKTYPDAPEVDEACRVLVLTHLAAKQPHEALRVLRGLQEEAPRGADLARPLRDIALHLSETKRDPQAVVLLKEVVQRYPASPLVPEAYFLMGEAYGRLGDEPRMVEAYQKATGLASAKGAVAPHQAYGVAFERLGEHYMRKENWAEALKWWQAWNPRSWCVTCQAGMQSRRTSMIALCRRRLGPFDDPVKRAQWAIRATTIGAVLVSGLLVVLWAEDARRRMKLRKMRAPKHLA
jgi:tetratricopeptide (TPR) repeat protein